MAVYPGDRRYAMGDRMEALPLKMAPEALAAL